VDQHRIRRLTRAVAAIPSRRDILRALTGVGLALGTFRIPNFAGAKKPCEGRNAKTACQARWVGTCNHEAPGFCSAADPAKALCDDSLGCVCLETTGGGTFCGSLAARASGCAACQRDGDCLVLGLPPGSACVPFATGACAGACESGMACVAPCDASPFAPEQHRVKSGNKALERPIEGED
jgi:hypothetical protein